MKHTTTTLLLAATLCASGLASRPARAQDYFSSGSFNMDMWTMYGNNNYITNNAISNYSINDGIYQSTLTDENTKSKSSGGVRKTTRKKALALPPKKALVTTTYRESPAITKRVQTRFVALFGRAEGSPEGAVRWEGILGEHDWIALWAKEAAENGLKRGDVADALTFYLVDSWLVANDVASASAAQFQGVRRQMATGMSTNAPFAKLSNDARQEMAENLIYLQITQRFLGAFALQSGDNARQKRSREAVGAAFQRGTGLDPRAMKLTDNGFAAK